MSPFLRRFSASMRFAMTRPRGLLPLAVALLSVCQSPVRADPAPADPTEAFVDGLLARMSLEEKVGQTIQADTRWMAPDDLQTYKLGSIRLGKPLDSLTAEGGSATPQAWLNTVRAFERAARLAEDDRHPAIPVLIALEPGLGRIEGATTFPRNIGLGAADDAALIGRIGEAIAEEASTIGITWIIAPTLAVPRDVRWGGTRDSFSDDPGLVSRDAAAMVGGLSRGLVASAAYLEGVDGSPLDAALAAGATTVSVAATEWPALVPPVPPGRLTTGITPAFDGFVISAANAQADIPGCTKYSCPTLLQAGVDMASGPDSWKELYHNTLSQVRDGMIPISRLDDAVRRILRVKARAGLFEGVSAADRPSGAGHFDRLGSPAHRALARQAVRQSLVLLKNDGALLPLAPRATILLVEGNAIGAQAASIEAGIRAAVEGAGGILQHSHDGTIRGRPDAAIVMFGEPSSARGVENLAWGEGNAAPLALLRRLRARHIPSVAVLVSGRPLWISRELNAAQAFVAAWQPGSGGGGVADLLFRRPDGAVAYDFSGKLSFAWPATAMPVGLQTITGVIPPPLFARGYGLTFRTSVTVPQGPETPSIAIESAGRDSLFYAGHVTAPWSLFLVDPVAALRVTAAHQTSPDDDVTVTLSGAGATLHWRGIERAGVRFTGPPLDLPRRARGGGALSLHYRVDHPPSTAVLLSFGGDGVVDVRRRLAAAPAGQWHTLSIPLDRFKPVRPFPGGTSLTLMTDGTLDLTVSDITLAPSAPPPSPPRSPPGPRDSSDTPG